MIFILNVELTLSSRGEREFNFSKKTFYQTKL